LSGSAGRSRPLSLQRASISPADQRDSVRAVAFVCDLAERVRPAQEILRTLFGFTPAECRVALLLGDGHAQREISQMLGVSSNTLKSHLASIYAKTNTSRQCQLVRLLMVKFSALAVIPQNSRNTHLLPKSDVTFIEIKAKAARTIVGVLGSDALLCASGGGWARLLNLIAAIGPIHDRHLPTKKTSRVVHDHGIPDVRLYRGRTEVEAVHHLRNGPLPRAR
jgi:DNA-binding CsgD family transcriptional regulator